ncbi:DUF2961 domain-containing protein [Saccharopolyspora sp. HNM0983]|uniref:DUF2961 domain-containing protein n=1 Tax=Saccharopolyspora montiporae TaxID=2781240 RepID=A0A929G1S9_9PSEU|nr:glycoside hydrolase family 172 protein [Saccharopolyspora sp. HNM0983]MBE9376162.1 DUF2961 domain-containing protein [Saccharopolyspora sp. HNM0983]
MTVRYDKHGSSLRDLVRLRDSRRRRVSSWDRSGGNDDRRTIAPGATATLAEIAGAGSITHIWVTVANEQMAVNPWMREPDYLRRLVLRAYWDGEADASVEVPLGDFFGVGHGTTRNFVSAPLQMSPEDGKSFNCFFHMPFAAGARLEVTSELEHENVVVYYYIDYEEFDELEDGIGRFHAQYRQALPCAGVEQASQTNAEFLLTGTNLDGTDNYTVLDAQGRGHYVGCVLNVRNARETSEWNWYGEGDDMIFLDGESWPPSLHGTGTEDYFNTAWCPTQTYSAPYHGITMPGGENWSGRISLYRFHIEDPVTFSRSIRVSIEHGHANKRSDDFSSVAYWYQQEPHRPFTLPAVHERVPHPG